MNARAAICLLLCLLQFSNIFADQQQEANLLVTGNDSVQTEELREGEESVKEKTEYDEFIRKPAKDPMDAEPVSSNSFDLEYFKSTFGTLPGIMVVIGGVVIFAFLLRLIGGYVFEER